MEIGILGTGMVGQNIGAKLFWLGHNVMIGTRDVSKTMARTDPDMYGNPPFSEWIKQNSKIKMGSFAEAAAHGELIINATTGLVSMEALKLVGKENLDGKILMDIANPLDFSKGTPPFLSICNTDSLGEQIQRAFPKVRVVKTLNTVNAMVMVNPKKLKGADHSIFLSGNDAGAKCTVKELLKSMGWKDIIDLGDITTARGTEMILPIWIRLYGVFESPVFNVKVVR
jgi:predicted dinucleotide-binding enzyme